MHRMRLVCAAFVGYLAFAAGADAKTINLSTRSEADGQYEIAFCARKSPTDRGGEVKIPGHMFVAYSHSDLVGERDFLAIGHTIQADVGRSEAAWSYFEPVAGRLKEEHYTSISQRCLAVIVNKEDYEAALEMTRNPLDRMGITRGNAPILEAYSLSENDCMTFALDVAGFLKNRGLKVPERGTAELPLDYMNRLIVAN
jgi:hypothetical protein